MKEKKTNKTNTRDTHCLHHGTREKNVTKHSHSETKQHTIPDHTHQKYQLENIEKKEKTKLEKDLFPCE